MGKPWRHRAAVAMTLQAPLAQRRRLRLSLLMLTALASAVGIAIAWAESSLWLPGSFAAGALHSEEPPLEQSADSLAELSESELASMDPIVVNLTVAKGVSGLGHLDIAKYVAQVDQWSAMIKSSLDLGEASSHDEPAYRQDPDLWRVGGMAIALTGPRVGLKYTADHLDPAIPEQSFVHGVVDLRSGTCANMPVLYLGIAHRLGWPLKAVVSGDHMWVRWDDGVKRFNLEATNAETNGQVGSFSSLTDDELAHELKTPHSRIASGSDFTSLTPRQTLAVYLQSRAGYWATRGHIDKAHHDISLAHRLFPANYDIAAFVARTEQGLNGHNVPIANHGPRKIARPHLTDAEFSALNAAYFRSIQTPDNAPPTESSRDP